MLSISIIKLILLLSVTALGGYLAGRYAWEKFLYGKIDMSSH